MPTENELYSPKKPVKIGESWKIDREKYIATFEKDEKVDISNLAIDGTFSLEGIEKNNNKKYLKVTGVISLDGMKSDMPSLPIPITDIKTMFYYTALLPTEKNIRRLKDEFTIELTQTAEGTVKNNEHEYFVRASNKIIERTSRKFSY